jgi:hypothetical protein
METRSINNLTAKQRNLLADVKDAIEDQDLILDIDGLHPSCDHIVGTVECPYDGWRTKDLAMITLFVFEKAPKLKLTAEGIAANYALRRDASYGL